MKRQLGYLMIGLCIALAIATVAGIGLWNALDSEREAHAKVRGEYTAFKKGVADAGTKAEADKREALKLQEKNHADAIKALEDRHYHLGVKYAKLRDAGTSQRPGSGDMPAVPDPARPVDATARDNRLLDLLQHAENQSLRLLGLQEWVAANRNACGPR